MKNKLKNIIILLISLFGCIVFIELASTIFINNLYREKIEDYKALFNEADRKKIDSWQSDPNNDKRGLRCNRIEKYRRARNEWIGDGNDYEFVTSPDCFINSWGFRGEEFIAAKASNTVRVIILGDSCTEGFMLYYNETYPAILQKKLDASSKEKKYEVWNLGVAGTSFKFQYDLFKNRLRQYDPDIVIFGHTENDYNFYSELQGINWEHSTLINNIQTSFPDLLKDSYFKKIFGGTSAYIALNRALYTLKMKFILYNYYSGDLYREELDAFRDIKKISREDDFELILLLFTFFTEEYEPIEWIRKIPKEEIGITTIDLAPRFDEYIDDIYYLGNKPYFGDSPDMIHPNPIANEIAADALFKEIIK